MPERRAVNPRFRSAAAVLLLAALVAFAAWQERAPSTATERTPAPAEPTQRDDSLERAIRTQARDALVTGRGTVVRLLRDDEQGSRHQRFVVDVGRGRTVLIAHNIDLAARVAPLRVGDRVEFAGEFEWNERGGVVHWTHPDPRGRHRAGWVRVVAP
jgi:hypothetical protein